MTIADFPKLLTAEELLAFPDDGIDRVLIRGEVRDLGMTRRNHKHAFAESRIAQILQNWLDEQPAPRGAVGSGEMGFRVRRNPDTMVGIDVAYISAEMAQSISADKPFVEGPPVLAVEIFSPSDQQQDIADKIEAYLAADVKLVWIVEPVFRTITIYRPDAAPEMVNSTQQLTAELHLPGFAVSVADVFG